VVNAVLLKPLAYRDADRILTLSTLWKKTGAMVKQIGVFVLAVVISFVLRSAVELISWLSNRAMVH
jgi:hypothetical protein